MSLLSQRKLDERSQRDRIVDCLVFEGMQRVLPNVRNGK